MLPIVTVPVISLSQPRIINPAFLIKKSPKQKQVPLINPSRVKTLTLILKNNQTQFILTTTSRDSH